MRMLSCIAKEKESIKLDDQHTHVDQESYVCER